ncbi:mitochondrial ribonuclease P protein 1 homolog [Oppia nitens]|uniref:mitochondrial ribonuclease P protein 1 homolog n=1 Tax=Oppia nitens TaxID=1686743 RepID=UPI0023DAB22F|nr:mitochondrial ribonuclease P protein 1 homolog [Oppia nitens]
MSAAVVVVVVKRLSRLVDTVYRQLKYNNRFVRKWKRYLWPTNSPVNWPNKCRRYPDLMNKFMAERDDRLSKQPIQRLTVDMYRDLIADSGGGDSEAVITEEDTAAAVREIVDYFNSSLIRSRYCPETVTVKDMKYMLGNIGEFYRRKQHLDYMFVHEFDCWRQRREHEANRSDRKAKELAAMADFRQIGCFDSENRLQYGFWRNTLFTRYFNQSAKQYSFNRLRTATLYGQKLVIDCSFDTEMQDYETESVGRQLAGIYHTNRLPPSPTTEPFDLYFCNCRPDGRVYRKWMKYMRPLDSDLNKYYVNVTENNYLDMFPKEQLIYLTPDARQVLTEFDPNAIYILGSLVGKTCSLPLTKWKAEREGLQHYKLPIHMFVKLNPGVKRTQSFLSCFKILLEMKDHNNWELAFNRGSVRRL